ncbi:hypothetical protein T03_11244 [Trichinella britovi]|uniref:Uncharacterized protein n=1 Tax=Trichinella britovi TaxID=45882 RepID=A0A0V1CU93_TRIBR|nr:hypothetical protein T03_11244 [Trichinella britovi]
MKNCDLIYISHHSHSSDLNKMPVSLSLAANKIMQGCSPNGALQESKLINQRHLDELSQAPELIILKLILLWSIHSKFYELLKAVRMFFNQCTKGNIHIMQTEEKQYCSRDILDFSTTEHVYRFLKASTKLMRT